LSGRRIVLIACFLYLKRQIGNGESRQNAMDAKENFAAHNFSLRIRFSLDMDRT